jgi:anti-anti-sigma factor
MHTKVDPVRAMISVFGDVEGTAADRLRQVVDDLLREAGGGDITVDLAGATFLGSAGIGSLLACRAEARQRGRDIGVRNPSAGVRWVLGVAGLRDMIDVGPADRPADAVTANAVGLRLEARQARERARDMRVADGARRDRMGIARSVPPGTNEAGPGADRAPAVIGEPPAGGGRRRVPAMRGNPEGLWLDAFSNLLDRSHLMQPDQLADAVDAAVSRLGVRTTIYLVDDEQRALHPIPQAGRPARAPMELDGSVPGRVFCLVHSMPAGNGGGWWVPMVDGTDRLGVIEFAVAAGVDIHDDLTRQRCETMAGLVGHLITVTAPKGDFLHQVRRSRPMSTGAELLSHMVPPLTSSCDRLALSAVLEPCYDVGGDGFDYAIDGALARMLILDAVGHGLRASITCTVALAAIRAARRAGADLEGQARAVDAAVYEQFGDDARFATGILAELDMDTGRLSYINAGHPAPLLLRAGKVVRELPGGRRVPLGLDGPCEQVGHETMEPGDRLLLYTDGVTEARDAAGELFGTQRLIDHAERHAAAGLPAPETLRRLAHAVATHHDGPATDDATLLLAEWSPAAVRRVLP